MKAIGGVLLILVGACLGASRYSRSSGGSPAAVCVVAGPVLAANRGLRPFAGGWTVGAAILLYSAVAFGTEPGSSCAPRDAR